MCGANFSPPPLALGTAGSRGGTIDLPTPKRAASGYIGQLTAPRVGGGWDDSALDLKLDAELPSLFNDLELGEILDAALPGDGGVGDSRPAFLGLDLRDLPAPVGPRPRSPLSLRSASSGATAEPRLPALAPRPQAAPAPGPSSKPLGLAESEPAPLPAPPPRGPLAELVNADPAPALPMPALAAAGEGRGALRPEPALPSSAAEELAGPPAAKRASNPALGVAALAGPPVAKRVSNPALAGPAPAGPPAAKRASNPALVVPPSGALPPGKRASNPALVVPPPAGAPAGKRGSSSGLVAALPRETIERETLPLPRRSSQPGLAMLNKPVHTLFDASEPPPQLSAPPRQAADSEPAGVSLPALPSDESGNARQAASSDFSGLSVLSGQPAGSSTVTAEPRPVRLGYLIAGLAVLAILLTVIIAHIAGTWHKHALQVPDKAAPTQPPASAAPAEPGPY